MHFISYYLEVWWDAGLLFLFTTHHLCPLACWGASGAAVGETQPTAAPGMHVTLDRRSRDRLGAQGSASSLAFGLHLVPPSLSSPPALAGRGSQRTAEDSQISCSKLL